MDRKYIIFTGGSSTLLYYDNGRGGGARGVGTRNPHIFSSCVIVAVLKETGISDEKKTKRTNIRCNSWFVRSETCALGRGGGAAIKLLLL